MTHEEFERLMADKLAGVISPEDAERLAGELRSDPSRAALAESVIAAQAEFEAGVPPLEEAARRMKSTAPPWQRTRRSSLRRVRLAGAVFRYAAVVGIAFGAGFWSARESASVKHDAGNPRSRVIQNIAIENGENGLADRYAQVSRTFPKSSSLSHALLSIARQ